MSTHNIYFDEKNKKSIYLNTLLSKAIYMNQSFIYGIQSIMSIIREKNDIQ